MTITIDPAIIMIKTLQIYGQTSSEFRVYEYTVPLIILIFILISWLKYVLLFFIVFSTWRKYSEMINVTLNEVLWFCILFRNLKYIFKMFIFFNRFGLW